MEACDSIIRADCLGPVIYHGYACWQDLTETEIFINNSILNVHLSPDGKEQWRFYSIGFQQRGLAANRTAA